MLLGVPPPRPSPAEPCRCSPWHRRPRNAASARPRWDGHDRGTTANGPEARAGDDRRTSQRGRSPERAHATGPTATGIKGGKNLSGDLCSGGSGPGPEDHGRPRAVRALLRKMSNKPNVCLRNQTNQMCVHTLKNKRSTLNTFIKPRWKILGKLKF